NASKTPPGHEIPQQSTAPPASTAQVPKLLDSCVTAPSPDTSSGAALASTPGTPSCPKTLLPQQATLPSWRKAQAWKVPAATAATLPSERTRWGRGTVGKPATGDSTMAGGTGPYRSLLPSSSPSPHTHVRPAPSTASVFLKPLESCTTP